jgi:hypothetical protein
MTACSREKKRFVTCATIRSRSLPGFSKFSGAQDRQKEATGSTFLRIQSLFYYFLYR